MAMVCEITIGVKIGWRAHALLMLAKVKQRLGLKVDVDREAERIMRSIFYTVDGKVRGRLGDIAPRLEAKRHENH